MPGIMEPPGRAQDFTYVDPTPTASDITSLEQAREAAKAAPAPASASPPPAAPVTPPAREVTLDKPSDANLANQIPQTSWDELDKLATLDSNGQKIEPVKPVEAPAETPTEAPPETPAPLDAAADAELEKQVQAFKTLKEVRTAHKEALKRERAWKEEQAALGKKLADAEARSKEFDPEVIKATTAELEATRKRAADLDNQVKLLDYTRSGEFHERHVKPLAKALEAAYADLGEMNVAQDDGSVRKATENDFKRLLSMPAQEAGEVAEKMFGKFAAGELMAHRRQVVQLERAKREAVESAAKSSEEARQRQTVEVTQRTERLNTLYKQRTSELESKFPDLFKPREGDDEGNQLLSKGHEMVSLIENENVPAEDRVKIAAEIKYRAASYGRVVRDNQRMKKALDEAVAKLKNFDRSAPDVGDGSKNGVPEPTDPWEKANRGLESIAKPMR